MTHDCPGPECHPYPTFDDDPARWGLLPEPPMTEAELAAAAELDAWGPRGPSASYAEWVARGPGSRNRRPDRDRTSGPGQPDSRMPGPGLH